MIRFSSTAGPLVAERGDPMRAIRSISVRSLLCLVFTGLVASLSAYAQSQRDLTEIREEPGLSAKIEMLTRSVEQMQNELQQSRLEIQQLREVIAQMAQAQ